MNTQPQKFLLIGLFLIVALVFEVPFITYSWLHSHLDYSPSLLNAHWSNFDDIVKMYPAWNLALNGSITGKIGISSSTSEIFPNVLQEFLPTLLLAIPIWLSQNIDAGFFIAPLYTALAAVLIAVWANKELGHRPLSSYAAICIAIISVTAYHFFRLELYPLINYSLDQHLAYVDRLSMNTPFARNSFYRPHTLGASYFIFCALFLWLYSFIQKREHSPRFLILGCLLISAQFYSYIFFSITAGFMVLATLVAVTLAKKDTKDLSLHWKPAVHLAVITLAALFIASPSISNTLDLLLNNQNEDWVSRIRGKESIKVFWATNEVLAFCLISALFMPTKAGKYLACSLGIAVVIIENLEVLTGFNIQSGHTYFRTTLPLIVASTFVILLRAWSKICVHKSITFLSATLLTAGALYYINAAVNFGIGAANLNAASQHWTDHEKIIAKTIKELPKGQVATLFPRTNEMVIVNTEHSSFLPFAGHQPSNTSNEDIEAKLATTLWLANASNQQIHELFAPSKGKSRYYDLYPYYFFQRRFEPRGPIPVAALSATISNQVNSIQEQFLEQNCISFPLPDYLILGGWGSDVSTIRTPTNSAVKQLANTPDYGLFEINKQALSCAND